MMEVFYLRGGGGMEIRKKLRLLDGWDQLCGVRDSFSRRMRIGRRRRRQRRRICAKIIILYIHFSKHKRKNLRYVG